VNLILPSRNIIAEEDLAQTKKNLRQRNKVHDIRIGNRRRLSKLMDRTDDDISHTAFQLFWFILFLGFDLDLSSTNLFP